ncbi:hypothetical protein ACM39_03395 [Chryseobacterium sp. FH2]|uniref:hypothetical protein n=1 Tax=Chryseobacterium sp. FH2 TaxID=1674291 RepID=UPI00065AB8B4|nr:hypothetical protein [Chryseobacterium sp. FH2]KMQ69166.1 hypothetical protein ACM39_03395 [Chryseobacterium sp. FH2]
MKKILFATAFGVAGLVSAKSTENVKTDIRKDKIEYAGSELKESKSIVKPMCYSYGIIIGCTNDVVVDTACGATFAIAQQCMIENGALMNEYFCK